MPTLMVSTSLRPLHSKPWVLWTRHGPTLCQSGKKDLLNVRRWQGRSFSVPESFGAGATSQCCLI